MHIVLYSVTSTNLACNNCCLFPVIDIALLYVYLHFNSLWPCFGHGAEDAPIRAAVCFHHFVLVNLVYYIGQSPISWRFSRGLEVVLQGSSWSPYDVGQLANLLVIVRALKWMHASVPEQTLITTLLRLPYHLAPVMGIVVCLFYVYALLGLPLFRGVIKFEPPV